MGLIQNVVRHFGIAFLCGCNYVTQIGKEKEKLTFKNDVKQKFLTRFSSRCFLNSQNNHLNTYY